MTLSINKFHKYADLVRTIAQAINDERASKCGYDLLMGLESGNVEDRFTAWERYLDEHKNNQPHTDAERDGVWVPAIPF